jgi:hypothetical protein
MRSDKREQLNTDSLTAVQRWIGNLCWFLLVACVLLSQPLQSQEKPMHHYVLIFRPTRTLTADELKQRAIEIPAWVKRVSAMGITIDPKALGELAIQFSQQDHAVVSHEGPADRTLTNLVFFDATSQEEAVEVARMHPGLHYDVAVELRDWTSPAATAPKQN